MPRFNTLLVGFGKIGAGYADDPLMSRYYEFATHAQVLFQHPCFLWEACVDPSEEAQVAARDRWQIPIAVSSIDDLPSNYHPDVVVIATPPEVRSEIIDAFPAAKAFFLEKPIGYSAPDAQKLVARCDEQGALVQVGLWRRADAGLRSLVGGDLSKLIGKIQHITCIYGNGLRNNGTHMVDMVRMFAGEVASVQALPGINRLAGPLKGDIDVSFSLELKNGVPVIFLPVDFQYYRENGMEIWGDSGRLSVLQEGLVARVYKRKPNRAMQNEWELNNDTFDLYPTMPGRALYDLYSNLADALSNGEALWSTGVSAVSSEIVIDAVVTSVSQNFERVRL